MSDGPNKLHHPGPYATSQGENSMRNRAQCRQEGGELLPHPASPGAGPHVEKEMHRLRILDQQVGDALDDVGVAFRCEAVNQLADQLDVNSHDDLESLRCLGDAAVKLKQVKILTARRLSRLASLAAYPLAEDEAANGYFSLSPRGLSGELGVPVPQGQGTDAAIGNESGRTGGRMFP